jgi:hypothetical protein
MKSKYKSGCEIKFTKPERVGPYFVKVVTPKKSIVKTVLVR